MTTSVAVLFANDAFYTAFAGRDASLMQVVWSERDSISCVHPGWPALIGREAVMASWTSILGNMSSPQIRCLQPEAFVIGDIAYVICHEQVSDGFLIATNIFLREGSVWKMVHHQAGPAPPPDGEGSDSDAESPALQ